MGTPNNVSDSSTTIQVCIGKLFAIENIVTYLGYQLKEVSACLVGAESQMDPERVKADDLALMSQMSTQELMHMANIEEERRCIMESWRKVESQKSAIIETVKSRLQGRAD